MDSSHSILSLDQTWLPCCFTGPKDSSTSTWFCSKRLIRLRKMGAGVLSKWWKHRLLSSLDPGAASVWLGFSELGGALAV